MIDVIANRYAEALFQLSEDENITKEIYNELHDVVEVIKNNKELDKKRKIHPGTYDRFPLNSTDMHYTGDRVLQ